MTVLGTWSQVASPELIDMLGEAGFAFTIIDVEHGYFGLETAENLFRACKAAGLEPWVRVPTLDPVLIGKALDCGARSVVVPGIASAEAARQAVAAGRFAPEGTRGACPCVRAGGHFIRDWDAYVHRQHTQTGVVLLVETAAGVAAFDDIIATGGVQSILLGPFDLSVSLEHGGDYQHPAVQEALLSMHQRAATRGLEVIVPVFSPDLADARAQLAAWRERGVRRFVVGTDKILISDQFARYRAALGAP